MYCKESFYWLLRFGHKNGGPWDDCNCEACENDKNLPDENDAWLIIDLLEKHKQSVDNK